MPNLPSIVITPIAIVDPHCQTTSRSPAQERDIWSDFLSLKISANTQRAYAKAIADFYQRVYDEAVSPESIALLWDNALRRGEVCSLDIGDFSASGRKLTILGKGKISKISIDLSSGAAGAISHWLELRRATIVAFAKTVGSSRERGGYSDDDPMFISLSRNQPGHRLGGSAIYAIDRSIKIIDTSQELHHRSEFYRIVR